jgi:hypothetical protein
MSKLRNLERDKKNVVRGLGGLNILYENKISVYITENKLYNEK